VLVTGASGEVGLIACRLATLAGARVVGQVRQARSAPRQEHRPVRAMPERQGAEAVARVAAGVSPGFDGRTSFRAGPLMMDVRQVGLWARI
jgi:NADPH:quinone reductase-like Zn-dependent oxidoreductase